MVLPDFTKPFSVAVDASDVAIGATLLQDLESKDHPVCFFSRKLNTYQKHYAIVEKEALALLTAVRVFSVYFGTNPTTVYTDHSLLTFLEKMFNQNQKLLRWLLELQQYNLNVVGLHRAEKDNLFPDILSRPSQ